MTPRGPKWNPDRTSRRGTEQFATGRPNPPTLAEVADEETLDLVFKALDSPVRRGILGAIHDWGGEMRSSVIAERFDLPWQGVSRHLRILTEAGLLRCQELSNGRLYSIDEHQMRSVAGRWIARVATPGRWTKDGRLVHDFDE